MFLSVRYYVIFLIYQFCELDLLKTTKKEIYEKTITIIDFDYVLYLCMFTYIIRYEENISVKKKLTVTIISKENHHRVFVIRLF